MNLILGCSNAKGSSPNNVNWRTTCDHSATNKQSWCSATKFTIKQTIKAIWESTAAAHFTSNTRENGEFIDSRALALSTFSVVFKLYFSHLYIYRQFSSSGNATSWKSATKLATTISTGIRTAASCIRYNPGRAS